MNVPLIVPYEVRSKSDRPLHLHVQSTCNEIELFTLTDANKCNDLERAAYALECCSSYEDTDEVQQQQLVKGDNARRA